MCVGNTLVLARSRIHGSTQRTGRPARPGSAASRSKAMRRGVWRRASASGVCGWPKPSAAAQRTCNLRAGVRAGGARSITPGNQRRGGWERGSATPPRGAEGTQGSGVAAGTRGSGGSVEHGPLPSGSLPSRLRLAATPTPAAVGCATVPSTRTHQCRRRSPPPRSRPRARAPTTACRCGLAHASERILPQGPPTRAHLFFTCHLSQAVPGGAGGRGSEFNATGSASVRARA